MSVHDEFFEELLILAGAIKAIRGASEEDLPEETLLALESANATLSTRALEILDGVVSDAISARPPIRSEGVSNSPVEPSTTTADLNTSSQPAPADLQNSPKPAETTL